MKYLETENIELKKILNDTFEKEVVAFLNTHDGAIYIGVEDNGEVCGVDISNLDNTMKKIADIISTGILPNPQELINVFAKYEDGKYVIEVNVKKGHALYYINKYGRSSKGCYVRVGTSCRSMTEEQINNRYGQTYLANNDITEIESKRRKFSFKQLKIYYCEMKYHLNDETFEENLDLLTSNGKYNLLAELMSDVNRFSIKIARFQGKDKSILIEKSEYGYQCLLVAIDRMLNRLEAENYTMSIMTGTKRSDKRLLDMHSLKEVLINAIVHNDWTRVEPAVYIFEDRIEIISYGGLPFGESIEMFFKGISTPRNKALMRILGDLDYSEQTGHGIPDVIDVYGKEVFDINENYINVVLPFNEEVMKSEKEHSNVNVGVKLNKTQYSVYTLIKNNPNITYIELAKKIKKSDETVRRNIKSLVELKLINRIGSNKKGHWEIIVE